MYERSMKLIFLSILWIHFSIHHILTRAYLKRVDLQYHSFLFSFFLFFLLFLDALKLSIYMGQPIKRQLG